MSRTCVRPRSISVYKLSVVFCRWAESQGLLKSNPAAVVKSLRIDKRRRPTGMTEAEVHCLLRVAGESKRGHAKRNYGLLQLLLQTGLRVGEVTNLKVGDVQIRDRSGEVQAREGKSNNGCEVPLNASARRALRAYLQLRPKAQPDEPLFLSDRKHAFSSRAIQTLLQRLASHYCNARVQDLTETMRRIQPLARTARADTRFFRTWQARPVCRRPCVWPPAAECC